MPHILHGLDRAIIIGAHCQSRCGRYDLHQEVACLQASLNELLTVFSFGNHVPDCNQHVSSSEQRPTQLRKYRLAIEPIAACYACFLHRIPTFHSDELSKSKPFGIFVWCSSCSILTVYALSSSAAGGATHVSAPDSALFCPSIRRRSDGIVTCPSADNDGIVRLKSAYPIGETIERLKKDIADKGIKFFDEIDQSKLAADAGHQASTIGAADLRKPAARHTIHHRKCQCRTRLAGTASRLRERERRGVDCLHRF